MGKRKKSSRKPQGPKKRENLSTVFACVFCNHETSVTVKIDKKAGIGTLNCKNCGQNYQSGTNYLTQSVDVYYDWIDACDAVAQETAASAPKETQPSYRQSQARANAGPRIALGDKPTAEDDGFIDDDDADGEADFVDD